MPYVTNFGPGDFINHQQVIDEVNKRFGTDLEIRSHPRPDNTFSGTRDLHSLWSPHDWVKVQQDNFPYAYNEWWKFYICHVRWSGIGSLDGNKIWADERQRYRDAGQGMDYPWDNQ